MDAEITFYPAPNYFNITQIKNKQKTARVCLSTDRETLRAPFSALGFPVLVKQKQQFVFWLLLYLPFEKTNSFFFPQPYRGEAVLFLLCHSI